MGGGGGGGGEGKKGRAKRKEKNYPGGVEFANPSSKSLPFFLFNVPVTSIGRFGLQESPL